MRFHAHKHAVDFELGGKRYKVAHGDEVEIPDHIAYCVESRGLPLHKGASPTGGKLVLAEGVPRTHVPLKALESIVSRDEAKEALADVTGEDELAEGHEIGPGPSRDELHDRSDGHEQRKADDAADEPEADVAERTFQQLKKQGIDLPGRRPHKGHEK